MSGLSQQDPLKVPSRDEAQAELAASCLTLLQDWQTLVHGGWNHAGAKQLLDETERITAIGERLDLGTINEQALELSAYLCSFVDDRLVPGERQFATLGGMVKALGGSLLSLGAPPAAASPAQPPPPPAAPTTSSTVVVFADRAKQASPAPVAETKAEPPAAPVSPASAEPSSVPPVPVPVANTPAVATEATPLRMPRSVCLLGADDAIAPGLAVALRERGYDAKPFAQSEDLLGFLGHAVPGALLIDARRLRVMARVAELLKGTLMPGDAAPALIVVSPDGDIGHRLLAMRAGASGYFHAPVDSLKLIARLDELLTHTAAPAYRVLLVDKDREHAGECARWLASRGMTARIAGNGQAALSALPEFRPDVIVLDLDLPDLRGIELTQLIRQQPEFATVPLIAASSVADIGARFDVIAAGGDEVLMKPLKERHLLCAVTSRVQRAQWLRNVIGAPNGRDPRTGLFPRSVLIERMDAGLGDRGAALFFIVLDSAERLREQVGLTGLAQIDTQVGNVVRTQLQETDLPAQFQDYAYVALVYRSSRGELTAAAENIRSALAHQTLKIEDQEVSLKASVGVCLLSSEPQSVDGIVANAQAARVAAAHLGGNRMLWFEPRELALLNPDPLLAVRTVLSRPLTPEQTLFEFQPIVQLTGKLVGQFEILFRLRSTQSQGTTVTYSELAPIANEIGQLVSLDRLVLTRAMDVRQEQLTRGKQLRLFVAQSIASVMDNGMPNWLAEQLKSRHLSGTGITLEIGCSEVVDRGAEAVARLTALREIGVRVCLSDYGRDWAAVHALRNLSVDYVRLAPLLVEQAAADKSSSDTLLALVRKAHQYGAAVIGPEIDNLQRAHVLHRLGIDYGAGPAFGRPLAKPEYDFSRPLW